MPIAPRGSRKAMRGSVNADGAGAKVFAGDGCSQERLSAPWPRFHGVDRADVYIIIHVRACCCGECALNPPPSRPIPHRRPSLAHAVPTHARRLRDARPPTAQLTPRSAKLPLLPFRFGHKKTAPHSACAMPNVSVDRRCGRSFGLVSRALFAAVAGRWRVGVGLRPQPWALRSRRCGRVLRA